MDVNQSIFETFVENVNVTGEMPAAMRAFRLIKPLLTEEERNQVEQSVKLLQKTGNLEQFTILTKKIWTRLWGKNG